MIRQEICQRVKQPSNSDGEKLASKLNNLIKHHLSKSTVLPTWWALWCIYSNENSWWRNAVEIVMA